ncbi:hypothetical protein DWB77_02874 [Streptomyces hundungensis]|uniref:YcaO domain-containing protein n=1 Tax=Streptomyces hundungensis TaxID=1077946 RepID=A0A387HA58_9ACTN|nr:hypothetical protein [Streptomyces hundungensis]AYG80736.1 hypothetical protein DWB77_02874 [Streptomyces hundungensis]
MAAERNTGVVLARPDVSVVRTVEGVWVGVGAASLTVKGGAAFELVSTLVDRADGSLTDAALLDGLPQAARPAAERLLGALVAHGCVVLLDDPMSRHEDERGAAAHQLVPHFSQLTKDPAAALDRLVRTTLVLYGRPAWLDGLRTVLDAAPPRGARIVYRSTWQKRPAGRQDAELVVVDADGRPHEETVRIQDELLAGGVPHGVAGTVGGRYWILWSDDDTTGCWDCLHRYARTWPHNGATPPVPGGWAAATLAHAAQSRLAGLPTGAALSLDPGTLAVKQHPVWPFAGCRCGRVKQSPAAVDTRDERAEPLVRRNIASPHDDPRRQDEDDRIVATLGRWTDELIGPFLGLDGEDAPQVPFGRALATVLVDTDGASRIHRVSTATLSTREAVYQAALNAIERCATRPGESGGPGLGAGWTEDEALYRALLRRTSQLPYVKGKLTEFTLDGLGDDACARAARYLQPAVARATGRDPVRWTATRLPNGLHLARAHGADAVATEGLGACRAEAVCAALLRLVNDDDVLVPLNPHFRTWPEVWRHITKPHGVPARHTVPFLGDQVRLVEVA